MKKILSYMLVAILASISVYADIDAKSTSFNLEFIKNGVYEFAFYESDAENAEEISYLVFAPDNPSDLVSSDYNAEFAVKWNIQSPLKYILSLEFSSSPVGSSAADFMLRSITDANKGYNFSFSAGTDSRTFDDAQITSPLKFSDRTSTVKEGSASDTVRTGSETVKLNLVRPSSGFSQGQYLGYIRMVLKVG